MGYYTVTIKPEGVAVVKQQGDHVFIAPKGSEIRQLSASGWLFAVYSSYGSEVNPYTKYLFGGSDRTPTIKGDIIIVQKNIGVAFDVFDELESVGSWSRVSQLRALGATDVDTLRKLVFEPGKLEVMELI